MHENVSMICLSRGDHGGLRISPRWPSSKVLLATASLEGLQRVQAELPGEIGLIVTRGFEPHATGLGRSRTFFRMVGIVLFRFVYADRRNEIEEIFGANGHDLDGTHVDVSLAVDGNRIRLLPLGVFTPVAWQRRLAGKHLTSIARVKEALVRNGFRIHRNETESRQIHCDLAGTGKTLA